MCEDIEECCVAIGGWPAWKAATAFPRRYGRPRHAEGDCYLLLRDVGALPCSSVCSVQGPLT